MSWTCDKGHNHISRGPLICGECLTQAIAKVKDLEEQLHSSLVNETKLMEAYNYERAENARLREVLQLIATPRRPDGTYNRNREACEQLAKEVLESRQDSEVDRVGVTSGTAGSPTQPVECKHCGAHFECQGCSITLLSGSEGC